MFLLVLLGVLRKTYTKALTKILIEQISIEKYNFLEMQLVVVS